MIIWIIISSLCCYGQEDCTSIQARIDRKYNLNRVVQYLKLGARNQQEIFDWFRCFGMNRSVPQRIPTDLISEFQNPIYQNRSTLYGKGYATQFYIPRWIPFFNRIQSWYSRQYRWRGKLFQINGPDENVTLYNFIPYELKYKAIAYNTTSIVDSQSSIVVDYRFLGNNENISKIRDEIREVPYRGQSSTGIYFGQAFRYNASILLLNDTESYQNGTNFFFLFNFILDFREMHQDNIPNWPFAT
jgi:hypothetical protein